MAARHPGARLPLREVFHGTALPACLRGWLGVLIAAAVLAGPVAPAVRADEAADQALINAVYQGNLRAMQAALRNGASFNARDVNGYTPLHWAAFRGYVVLAGYMLDRGAPVDVGDQNGYTPLMLAAWNGHDTVVRLLLDRGASRERLSLDGFTAYDYSLNQGHTQLATWLQPARSLYSPPLTRATAPTTPPDEPSFWRPRSSPRPTPVKTPFVRPEPVHHLEPVAGIHLSRVQFPIVGLHYRSTVQSWMSLRLGAEYGRTPFPLTGPLELGFLRLHAALLSNGPVYAGLGATHITLGSLATSGYTPSTIAPELIGGLRLGWGPLSASTELRFGVEGPSTFTAGLGGRF